MYQFNFNYILYTNDNELIGTVNTVPDNFTGIVEIPHVSKRWYVDGKLHRENGPALEYLCGHKEYYLNGQLHRIDGPAVEMAFNNNLFFLFGKEVSEKEHKEFLDQSNLT